MILCHRNTRRIAGDIMSTRREGAQSRHPNENKGSEEAIFVRQSRYVTEKTPVKKHRRSAD